MALSLGDISFGLGADTKGLQKAVEQLSRFSKMVDQTIDKQVKGAEQVARAYARQEHAIRQGLQQVLNMNQALRNAGAPPEMLARTTNAFMAFTRVLTSGQVDAVTFARAQDRLGATLAKTRRDLQSFAPPDQTRFANFNKLLRDLQSASVLAVGPLSGLGARINALASITGRSTVAMATFLGAVSAVTIAAVKLVTSSISTARVFDTINSSMRASTGNAVLAGDALKFVTNTAQELGIDIIPAAQGFSKLSAAAKGTRLEGQQTREVFTGIVQASRVLNLSGEQTERMLKTVEQMMSKGTVQAEELKNQLGDAMPGAMQMAAQAMGKTTVELQKMLEKGEVIADDFLPKFARVLQEAFGADAAEAANNLNAVTSRLSNSTLLMVRAFDQTVGVSEAYKNALIGITQAIDFATKNLDTIVAAIGAVTGGFIALAAPTIFSGVIALGNAVRGLAVAMLGLNAAMTAGPAGAFLAVLARLAVAAAGAAAGFYLMKDAIQTTDTSYDNLISSIDKHLEASARQKGAIQGVTDVMIEHAKTARDAALIQLEAAQTELQAALERDKYAVKFRGKRLSLFGNPNEVADAQNAITELEERIVHLNMRIFQLQNLPARTPPSLETMSKGFTDAKKKIDELESKLQGFTAALAARSQGTGFAQFQVDLIEAREIIKGVAEKDLIKLDQQLVAVGMAGTTTAERVANLVRSVRDAEDAFKNWQDRAEQTPKILLELNQELDKINSKTDALNKGPKAFEAWKRAAERTEALEAFRQKIADTALTAEEMTQKVNEFNDALDRQEQAQKNFDKLKEMSKTIEQGFTRAFDRIGEAITQAFVRGEDAAIDFGNIVDAVLSEMVQTMFEVVALNPLKQIFSNILTGVFSAGMGGAAGGGAPVNDIGSMGPGVGLYKHGGLIPNAHGNILTKPTLIPMARGMGIAREAGRDEAILPLERVSGGDLGVKAAGMGSVTNVYIINQSNAQVQQSEERNSLGGKDIKIMISDAVAQDIRSRGPVGRAMEQTFNINRRISAR